MTNIFSKKFTESVNISELFFKYSRFFSIVTKHHITQKLPYNLKYFFFFFNFHEVFSVFPPTKKKSLKFFHHTYPCNFSNEFLNIYFNSGNRERNGKRVIYSEENFLWGLVSSKMNGQFIWLCRLSISFLGVQTVCQVFYTRGIYWSYISCKVL